MQQEPELGRELFGYKKDDVDMLLAELHRDLRLIREENARLSSELSETREKLSNKTDYIPGLPTINELNIIPDKDGLIKENLQDLIDIQGVSTIWLFDLKGNKLSYFNSDGADFLNITAALSTLDGWVGRLESELGDKEAKLIFIEFDGIILFLYPIKPAITLGVTASVKAPIAEILRAIDKNMPKLRKIFVET